MGGVHCKDEGGVEKSGRGGEEGETKGEGGESERGAQVAIASASHAVGMARLCAQLERDERLRLLRLLRGVLLGAAERDAGHRAALTQRGFSIRKEPVGALVVLCELPCCQLEITRYYVRCDCCATLNEENSENREPGRTRMEHVPVYMCVPCGLKHAAKFPHHKAGNKAFEKRVPALSMSGTAAKLGAMITQIEARAAREEQAGARKGEPRHGIAGGAGSGVARGDGVAAKKAKVHEQNR